MGLVMLVTDCVAFENSIGKRAEGSISDTAPSPLYEKDHVFELTDVLRTFLWFNDGLGIFLHYYKKTRLRMLVIEYVAFQSSGKSRRKQTFETLRHQHYIQSTT